jgi:hypothetical protein
MSQETIIALSVIGVFLILGLIALFRFKSVKQTFEGLGFKIGISSSNPSQKRRPGAKDPADEGETGIAAARIGGRLSSTNVNALGKRSGTVTVGKDVIQSDIRASGKQKATTDIDGDVDGSNIDVRSG